MLTLQSQVRIELLNTEGSNAVVQRCTDDPANKNNFLATFKCVDDANRLEFKVISLLNVQIRTTEGQKGELMIYVIPKAPSKFCKVLNIPIKPLSLHERVTEVNTSPNSSLTIKNYQ